jgi:hypothetical protein
MFLWVLVETKHTHSVVIDAVDNDCVLQDLAGDYIRRIHRFHP